MKMKLTSDVYVALLPLLLPQAHAWSFGSSNQDTGSSKFAIVDREEWLQKDSLKISYLGCRWSYVIRDGNEGCRQDESEDGTTYWYQMANCRRANVAYTLYDGSNGRCSKNTFLQNFVSVQGLVEFAYDMNNYDSNNPVSYDDVADLPICNYNDGYYQTIGCSSSGGFTVDNFSDKYCTQYISTANNLKSLNKSLQKISCHECNSSSGDDDGSTSLCQSLLYNSDVCSYADSTLCSNPNGNPKLTSSTSSATRAHNQGSEGSLGNKVKYFFGTVFLVASFGMFLGILLTNRKKRRALLFRRSQGRSKRSKADRERRDMDKGEFA